jgi:hypothetical protein
LRMGRAGRDIRIRAPPSRAPQASSGLCNPSQTHKNSHEIIYLCVLYLLLIRPAESPAVGTGFASGLLGSQAIHSDDAHNLLYSMTLAQRTLVLRLRPIGSRFTRLALRRPSSAKACSRAQRTTLKSIDALTRVRTVDRRIDIRNWGREAKQAHA